MSEKETPLSIVVQWHESGIWCASIWSNCKALLCEEEVDGRLCMSFIMLFVLFNSCVICKLVWQSNISRRKHIQTMAEGRIGNMPIVSKKRPAKNFWCLQQGFTGSYSKCI